MRKLSLLFSLVLAGQLHAQVGINNPNPEETSILELKSFKRGFLLPRMDAQRRSEIIDPALGLVVYDTDYDMLFVFNENESSGTWFGTTPFRYYTNSSTASTNNVFTDPQVGNVVIGLSSSSNSLETAAKLNVHGSLRVGETPSASTDVPDDGLYVSGQSRLDGGIDVRGEVGTTSGSYNTTDGYYLTTFYGKGTVPIGGIIMWSGTTPPDGWKLCTGGSVYSTKLNRTLYIPDLSGRFIVAYGSGPDNTYSIGSGGSDDVNLTSNNLPTHTHASGTLSAGNTSKSHSHGITTYDVDGISGDSDNDVDDRVIYDNSSASLSNQRYTSSATVSHSHTISGSTGNNTTTGAAVDVRPAYYALAFIMRVE